MLTQTPARSHRVIGASLLALLLCLPAVAAADFVPGPNSPVMVGAGPFWVASADFDGDGRVDLVSANTDAGSPTGSVSVLLGQADGSYSQEAGSPIAVGRHPAAVAAADFNSDGRPDMAVSNFLSHTVTIFLRRAGGGFVEEAGSPLAAGPAPHSVVAGDFSGDGRPDLALPDYGGGGITVLLRRAGGGFEEEGGSPFATGSGPTQLAAADFDGDGRLDLAAANFASDDVSVLLRQAAGGFAEEAGSPVRVGTDPVSPAVADFDGDGRPDLAVTNQGSDDVTVLLRGAGGGFAEHLASPFVAGDGPYGLATGDFDDDGRTDLAATNEHSADVTILLGGAGGNFAAAPFSPLPAGRGPLQLAAADLDGDHRADLAIPNNDDGTVSMLLQRRAVAPVPVEPPAPVVTPAPGPGVTFSGPPLNLQRPGIVERAGAVLLCNPGTWTNVPANPVLGYEWLVVDEPRPNAPGRFRVVSTEAVFVRRATLIGKEIACRVTAQNIAGKTSATSASWLLAEAGPILLGTVYGNLRIRGIDIFQTVQPNSGAAIYGVPTAAFPALPGGGTPTSAGTGGDLQRTEYIGVPIDAGKPATAIVYLDRKATTSSSVPLEVSLTAWRDGRRIGTTQYASAVGPPRADQEYVTWAERGIPRHGQQFRLPLQWLEEAANGPIELEAKVALPSAFSARYGNRECAIGESCSADNAYRLTDVEAVRFHPLTFRAVELRSAGQAPGSLATPDQVLARTKQLFPGGEGFRAATTYDGVVDVAAAAALNSDDDACVFLHLDVRSCRQTWVQAFLLDWLADAPAAFRYQVTLGVHRYMTGTGVNGFEPGWVPGGHRLMDLGSTPLLFVNDGSAGRPLTSAAHELGHVLGAEHASGNCGAGADGQVAESWPNDQTGRLQGVKFDHSDVLSTGQVDPVLDGGEMQLFDLMAYISCVPKASEARAWLSAHNWNRFAQTLTAYPAALKAATNSARARSTAAAPAGSGFATGGVSPSGGRIASVAMPDGDDRVPGSVRASALRLRSLDAGGLVLLDAGVELESLGDGAAAGVGTFAGPVAAGAEAVELVRDGAVLDRKQRSRTPRVRLRSTRIRANGDLSLRWSTADPDGGALHAGVDYSADGGRAWRPLYSGPSRGSTVVPAAAMEGSRNARVRISADDGFGEARTVSRPLRVAGTPPAVTIVRPTRGEPVRAGERTVLTGSATDDRRRALTGRVLTWYSGGRRLGIGERVSARLHAGRQVLRLVARDRAGRSSDARRTIRVQAPLLRIRALHYPPRVGVNTRTVSLRIRTSAAATLRLGGRRYAVGPDGERIAIRLPARPATGLLRMPFTLSPAGPGRTVKGALEILRFEEASRRQLGHRP